MRNKPNLVHATDAIVLSRSKMDLDTWLQAFSGGWTNEDRLICQAAELGADREVGYDEEKFFEDAYNNEYLNKRLEPREATTTIRDTMMT